MEFLEELMLEGILASIGSVGKPYDTHALADSTIGLFKTEAISKGNPFHAGPSKNIDNIEYTTMGWLDWHNNCRLHSSPDYVPPVGFEFNHHAGAGIPTGDITSLTTAEKPRRFIALKTGYA